MRRDSGFTLIEALVALSILALAAVALIGATEAHIRNVNGLEARAIAQWIAENRLVELKLSGGVPPEERLSVTMLGRAWWVDSRLKPTTDPDLAAVEIRVGMAEDSQPTATLGGFLDIAAPPP